MGSELKHTEIKNVHHLIIRAAEKWGNKTALLFDETEESFSFHEVKKNAEHMASILTKLGINTGDKVAIMLQNVPEFPFTWLASGLIGAVTVPLNYRYQTFDASYIIHHSESKVVITTAEKVEMLDMIRIKNSHEFTIITTDQAHQKADGFLKDLQQEIENKYPLQQHVYSERLMNIQYTSGTTGKPKGCMLSQFYWINIAEKIANRSLIGINENDISLTSQPFYYMDPQWNTMAVLLNGATLVILDRFSPSVFWKKVQEYDITFFYVLGNMPVLLLKMPITQDEKNHRVRFIGCSAIPPHIHHQIEKRWGVPWYEVFGMTESGYDISMRREEHKQYVGTNAIGRGAIDREVRIMNEDGELLERGETGELVFRGKGMMDGYYKNPEATKAVLKNGWFHTGDLAYMNEEGVVFYVGRIKDMIRRSGENIAAAEVEEVIMLYEKVEISACTPVEDEIRGEEIKAYIVLKETSENHTEVIKKIINHCEDNLASFKVPRYWEIRKTLPTTPSERIAKHRLGEEQLRYYDRLNETWN
ncbi:AMP-binding protein [Pseudogracilibacillus auburnensis]|uniref:Crotonobetaine/carnitine-CoA ligase n=1 Tax=Pseudogracilibacillus auburnensis TaxID=1494959 RepID=A0A2V3W7V2_9BACI|nr:AMP-binding protein [Pseudogracilibacillus auburnensis]PXW90110.1 crotonobetaine/carnitine-CoA ligase [Pseudogracilibacillus auburnensis]